MTISRESNKSSFVKIKSAVGVDFMFYLFVAIDVQSLSYSILCNPMDCSMLGFPILHYLSDVACVH